MDRPVICKLVAFLIATAASAQPWYVWTNEQGRLQFSTALSDTVYAVGAVTTSAVPPQVPPPPAWTNTPEYAARVKAATLVGQIRAILNALSIVPVTDDQVFADVDAWTEQQDTVAALRTATRLLAAYTNLKNIVGDTTGLIKGDRVVSMDEFTTIVIDAEE